MYYLLSRQRAITLFDMPSVQAVFGGEIWNFADDIFSRALYIFSLRQSTIA
jgi:hypothetical protein